MAPTRQAGPPGPRQGRRMGDTSPSQTSGPQQPCNASLGDYQPHPRHSHRQATSNPGPSHADAFPLGGGGGNGAASERSRAGSGGCPPGGCRAEPCRGSGGRPVPWFEAPQGRTQQSTAAAAVLVLGTRSGPSTAGHGLFMAWP
jgi:hypothetical protein